MTIFDVIKYPLDYPVPTEEQIKALPDPLYDKWVKEVHPEWKFMSVSYWAARVASTKENFAILKRLMYEYEE